MCVRETERERGLVPTSWSKEFVEIGGVEGEDEIAKGGSGERVTLGQGERTNVPRTNRVTRVSLWCA